MKGLEGATSAELRQMHGQFSAELEKSLGELKPRYDDLWRLARSGKIETPADVDLALRACGLAITGIHIDAVAKKLASISAKPA